VAPELHAAATRTPSLEDIHASVPIPRTRWRRFLAFSGPALLVSVGYMDPGNWGTDLQAGSRFGYLLLWVLLMSNLMAMLLQSLASRLGIVTGRDLAQACRTSYPRPTVVALWLLCEIAIAACDLAEVIGTIIGLKLLFGLPYLWGLAVAAADTFLLLALQRRGVRLLELVTLALIAVIAVSFVIEIVLCRPDWAAVVRGFVPLLDPNALRPSLYAAIAMLGATVMPHNLYLHSALVQTRAFPQTIAGKRVACKYNLVDSVVALNGAFFINAAILILAAATFTYEVKTLPEAHNLLRGVWGGALASGLFAVALLASGQSSTLTGTLAGQVVMEGFVRLRLRPWVRRLLTRSLAILPALLVIALAGHETAADRQEMTAAAIAPLAAQSPVDAAALTTAGSTLWSVDPVDRRLLQLLVLSQAVLSFQLPFAIMPLVQFTGDRRWMGVFVNGRWLNVLAWTAAGIVVGLNAVLSYLQIGEWAEGLADAGWNAWWIYGTVGPAAVALALFLGWVTIYPWWVHREEVHRPVHTPLLPIVHYGRIGVAVELEGSDDAVLIQAVALARAHGARLVALHVVEGLGAAYYGPETDNQESRSDRARLPDLVDQLRRDGLQADGVLGYGRPAEELVRLALEQKLDLLVLGTHGHRFFADLALGQTVAPVLHRLRIPVLVVPNRPVGAAAGKLPSPPYSGEKGRG
jgi:manganese transport protein